MNAHLEKALELHKRWLIDHKEGERFCWEKIQYDCSFPGDLRGVDLTCADLSGAILMSANLSYINLACANLRNAHLEGCILNNADLSGAYLTNANLKYTNLMNADLSKADLEYANLSEAFLAYANLSNAFLECANLKCSTLFSADLDNADIKGANLMGADLTDAKHLDTVLYNVGTVFFALQCPEVGSYKAFKAARDKIIELEITEDALRSSATSRKCRASKAKVLSITELDGTSSEMDSISSDYDENFVYKVGETVEVKDFDTDRWKECASGIHHFLTRQEAVNYGSY